MKPKPDCRTCGACCWSTVDQPSFCDVTAEEALRFSPQFRRANLEEFGLFDRALQGGLPHAAIRTKWSKTEAGPFKGVDVCTCKMLDGSLMHKVRCRIYKDRPRTCHRAVKPGDRTCVELRRMFLDAVERLGSRP